MLSLRLIPVLLIISTGCLGPVKELYPEKEHHRPVDVFVIKLGWHVGIVFEGAYLIEKLPEHTELPTAEMIMVGWGDNKYYPAERAGVWLFLRAGLLPTGSVMHVVGFDEEVINHFKSQEIVRLQISKEGMKRMTGYLSGRFKKDESGKIIFASEGLFPESAFFKARGVYIFPNTSNKWTARVLRKSGLPITPFYAITSGNVMQQLRKEGKVILK